VRGGDGTVYTKFDEVTLSHLHIQFGLSRVLYIGCKRTYLTVERKLVELHEFEERSGDESCLADSSQAGGVVTHKPAGRALELADRILNVQARVPVLLPLQLVACSFLHAEDDCRLFQPH